jgi:tRNA (cytidine/uridine-2'-O-)-methyltransferase
VSTQELSDDCFEPAVNIVLVEAEIPQNTGNIARTCACIGARLHLVEPLGFHATERNLRRAGCDYWDKVEIKRWSCADAFFDSPEVIEAAKTNNLFLYTGQSQKMYNEVEYKPGAYLVFGRESRGLDQAIIDKYLSACVRIPMRDGLRSLNLSNAAAIGAYEALRQIGFPGLS